MGPGYIISAPPIFDEAAGDNGGGGSGTDQTLPFIFIPIGVAILLVASIACFVRRRRAVATKQQLSEIKSKTRDFQR